MTETATQTNSNPAVVNTTTAVKQVPLTGNYLGLTPSQADTAINLGSVAIAVCVIIFFVYRWFSASNTTTTIRR